ncbi:hypothetical protein PCASD_23845, partial [Puccinia coronata f. sp. avenae]
MAAHCIVLNNSMDAWAAIALKNSMDAWAAIALNESMDAWKSMMELFIRMADCTR